MKIDIPYDIGNLENIFRTRKEAEAAFEKLMKGK